MEKYVTKKEFENSISGLEQKFVTHQELDEAILNFDMKMLRRFDLFGERIDELKK